MEIISRFFQTSRQSFFLFGPRGTGKSTWIKEHYGDNAIIIDLLKPKVFRHFSAKPERLIECLDAKSKIKTIVIDEIQKAPSLLDVVHEVIETKQDHTFILTGSSSRKLKRSGVDLLAGRALVKSMHPFMASELKTAFSLDKALEIGMLPLILYAKEPDETIQSYADIYVKEEVQMESLVRNVGSFNRFLESVSFSHASILNISDIARDCQVGRKTVEGYLSILEDLLLSFCLPVFTRRAKRRLSSHPKFYFFDAGVFRSLRPQGPLDSPQETDGAALEGLIIQHLRAWNAYRGESNKLFFWRTKSGNEVDVVIYGKDTFCAIEIKNTSQVKPKMLNGLLAFQADYPEAKTCLLYRGEFTMKVKHILCMPCSDFLLKLVPGRPIPIDD
jgi:predicted AAA+ superfamily ATPase